MTFLLDTDTIIYWLNGRESIEKKVIVVGFPHIVFSIISKADLYYGAYKSEYVEENLRSIRRLSDKIAVVPFDNDAADRFGAIKADLGTRGALITDADIMIAAIAIANDMTLVTNNVSHFQRIERLQLENWA